MIAENVQRLILIAMMICIMVEANASELSIDYSHNVAGTGTVMTDFEMGSAESTIATGEVHGTGEVVSKYVYLSNHSQNVTIMDQFIFTKARASNDTSIDRYPMMDRKPGSFRLLGTVWSGKISSIDAKINS